MSQIKVNLKFCLRTAYENGITEHPQKVMKDFKIEYQHATPQSMGDCWWFWNCENVPDELPVFIKTIDLNPMEMVGFGLSKIDAIKIRDYKPVSN